MRADPIPIALVKLGNTFCVKSKMGKRLPTLAGPFPCQSKLLCSETQLGLWLSDIGTDYRDFYYKVVSTCDLYYPAPGDVNSLDSGGQKLTSGSVSTTRTSCLHRRLMGGLEDTSLEERSNEIGLLSPGKSFLNWGSKRLLIFKRLF